MNKIVLVISVIVVFYSIIIFFGNVNLDEINNPLKPPKNEDIERYQFQIISNTTRCEEIRMNIYNETHCYRVIEIDK